MTLLVDLLLLAFVAFPVSAAVDDPAVTIKQGVNLLAEGDDLADKGEYTEAVIRYKRAMERLLPTLRQIPFKHEVKRDVTRREDMKALLIKEIEQDTSPEEFRLNEVAFKLLGLLPAELNLKEMLAQVYSEEVAAFYDTKTKTMHLIEEPKPKTKPKPSFLERLFGGKSDFDKDENKTVIAHELTHALADQNFDIDAMQEAVKKDDDQSLALTALIEGEATLAMFGAGMDDWRGGQIVHLPAKNLESMFNFLSPFMPMMGSGKTLRSAPPILVESMAFPYFRGMVFCAKLTNERGWEGIDAAYRTPPQSTEQILHPEKFGARLDRPTAIDLGVLSPGAGWKELGRNVLGEMQMGVMLRGQGGKKTAAGWDGDRYAVFEDAKNKKFALAWLTTWDDETEAKEFAGAYLRYQSTKIAGLAPPTKPVGDAVWRDLDDRVYVVERAGQDVAIVEGLSPAATAIVVGQLKKATKTELKPRVNPHAPAAKPEPEADPVRTSE